MKLGRGGAQASPERWWCVLWEVVAWQILCWRGEEQGHGGREAGAVLICLLGGPLLRMVVDPPLVTRI